MIAYLKTTNKKVRLGRLTSKGYETWDDERRYIPEDELIVPSTDKREFLTELKVLMEKYNATIGWCCGEFSDLCDVYDSHIEISLNNTTDIIFQDECVDVNDVNAMLNE